jgi:iron complex outermembrane recepter protein
VNETIIDTLRGTFGLKGRLMDTWRWDLSYSYSRSKQLLAKNNVPNLRNYFAASDAVRDASGRIVCRSTLAGFDPGCVPLNPFGFGSVTPEAAAFILGDSFSNLRLQQNVVMANLSGDFGERFNFGAGPIAFAVGGEYRKEEADQTSDPISQRVINRQGLRAGVAPASIENRRGAYQFYNPQPFSGSYDIKEAYAELGLPLLRDPPFAQMLEANLAARYAHYSQSGGVWTWRAGVNYQVFDDLRLRYTRSRDIRGPNVVELFNTQTQTTTNVVFMGTTTQAIFIQSGNPALEPERADTETYGFVYRPSWLPGFQVSLDRYDINIDGAIGSLAPQQTIDQCAAGNQLACAQFTATPGLIQGRLQPLNLNVQRASGYDLEAAYNIPIGAGALLLRALVNHSTEGFRLIPGGTIIETLRSPANPSWSGLVSANYREGPFNLQLSQRFIGKSLNESDKTDDQLQANRLPAISYTNLGLSYRFGDDRSRAIELFGNVSNLFNTMPPISPKRPSSYNEPVALAYDTMGRYFTFGVRTNFR